MSKGKLLAFMLAGALSCTVSINVLACIDGPLDTALKGVGGADAMYEKAETYMEKHEADSENPEHLGKALKLLSAAANQGHTKAQLKLAEIHMSGDYDLDDHEQDFGWAMKAAELKLKHYQNLAE